jgi:hypothetical protein
MDIHWGFNNIQIKEGDKWKAAFITNHGLFEPLVMFFGMCNVLASFQQMADMILWPLIDQGCIFVYIDDVLIVGDTLQELDYWMQEVLTVMQDANLWCKPVKCQFKRMTVKYLGMYLTQAQIAVNPAKVTAINEWPVPQKLKDVVVPWHDQFLVEVHQRLLCDCPPTAQVEEEGCPSWSFCNILTITICDWVLYLAIQIF